MRKIIEGLFGTEELGDFLFLVRRPESSPQSPHGCLHLLVPQGVDQDLRKIVTSEKQSWLKHFTHGVTHS